MDNIARIVKVPTCINILNFDRPGWNRNTSNEVDLIFFIPKRFCLVLGLNIIFSGQIQTIQVITDTNTWQILHLMQAFDSFTIAKSNLEPPRWKTREFQHQFDIDSTLSCRFEGVCYPSKYYHLPPFRTTQVLRHMIRNLIFCNTTNVDQGRFRPMGHVCTVNKVTRDIHIDRYDIDTLMMRVQRILLEQPYVETARKGWKI